MTVGAPGAAGSRAAGRRARLWPALRARPRLLASVLFGAAVYAALRWAPALPGAARTLLGWNAGALLYLLLAWHLMREDDVRAIQTRALTQDEGSHTILALTVLAAAAVLLAVGTQLVQVRHMQGTARLLHLLLTGLTVLTSWAFTQVLFALHYAHDYYIARHRGQPDPLQFPGTRDPGYGDFFYFSCVLGTSAQTADVSFFGRALRPVGTLHCVLAYCFNAALLALAINVAAGLL